MNKSFIIAGVRNLLVRNYNVDVSGIDFDALVDESLSFEENWANFKDVYVQERVLCCPHCGELLE